jgi:hypothetical protein
MLLTAAVTVLLLGASCYAQEASGALSADDFLTPAQGGSEKIAAPAEVSVKGDVVTAATMQDAANKATELTMKDSGMQLDEPSFKLITSKGGGVGAIASGRASYATTATNKDAIRTAMRVAYIRAYMEAKKNLMIGFNGMSSEGKTIMAEAIKTIIRDDESLKNKEFDMDEEIVQRSAGFIKGYVVSRVDNFPEDSTICVTIAVNGKSLGKLSRLTPGVVETTDLKVGLTQVFDEIQRGISLPAGGRVIMTEAGESCFVGYGSALILDDSDPEMRSAMMNNARRMAEARARDSLVGLIQGDTVLWKQGVAERHIKEMKDFEVLYNEEAKNEETKDEPSASVERLAERKKQVLTLTETLETTVSIRRGVIPPGIVPRTFRDKDNAWYYAVVVYSPTLTQAAVDLSAEMKNATLVQPIRTPQSQTSGAAGTGGTSGTSLKTDVPRPSAEIKMIPTGSLDDE